MLCTKCPNDLPEEAFSWKNKAKGIRHKQCPECQAKLKKAHYERDKDAYKAKALVSNQAILKRNMEYVYRYLLEHPCERCGNDNPAGLDFHHLSDKVTDVARLVSNKVSIGTIQAEINKCIVLCAYCHRVQTGEDQGWYKAFLGS